MFNAPVDVGGRARSLLDDYSRIRRFTEFLCEPLAVDDFQVQSITETSPPKWHIAHVTWFFETFVLPYFDSAYRPFDEGFAYCFNSYYETVGHMHPRSKRGLLSRPTLDRVYAYRSYVDEHMATLLEARADDPELVRRVTLGLNHEQQHQELLLMDVKHNLSVVPGHPAYRDELAAPTPETGDLAWVEGQGGLRGIGSSGEGFAFDNESPRHQVLVNPHQLANRTVRNGEYLEFMLDGGYERPELWLADGWYHIQHHGWRQPLYWLERDGAWFEYTLGGLHPLEPALPVCHVSLYEADAYARWAGARLPEEAELELQLAARPLSGNFVDSGVLHPVGGPDQWHGDLWEWTRSPYAPYPGFRPLEGSMGEYNGKFMCNQMTLRGSGCCLTSADHARASYRNFFYPHDRWAMSGIRLASDPG